MALRKYEGSLMPEDSVRLSPQQALEHQWRMVSEWKPQSDVWPLRYGFGALSAITGMSAIYINSHFRGKLKLMNYGKASTYLTVVFTPSIIGSLFHYEFIVNDVLLRKTECNVCLQVRSSLIQLGFGLVYPLILSPVGNFMMAARHFTYDIPVLHKDFMGVLRLWRKIVKPISTPLNTIAIAHVLLAWCVTYFETKSVFTMSEKLTKLEKEYDMTSEQL